MMGDAQGNVVEQEVEQWVYFSQLLSSAGCEKHKATPGEARWFNIKNYSFVAQMPLRDLVCELSVRRELCLIATNGISGGAITKALSEELYADIISGKAVIGDRFKPHTAVPEIIYLADGPDTPPQQLEVPVRELNVKDIRTCHNALEGGERTFPLHPCYQYRAAKIDGETLLTALQPPDVELVYLSVDPFCTESQLVAAFKETLAKLRTQYNIFSGSNRTKPLTRRKIINIQLHSIIPLMDLLLWQFKKGWHLPLEQIYKMLEGKPVDTPNKDVEYHRTNFIKTKLSGFEKIISQGTFEQLLSTLRENEHLYDLSIRNLIDDEFIFYKK
ncbi:DUF6387 family protein [Serratia sp. T13T92]|uniref:DUF6387 family protein n=1 Tax=Serratia sp. T13T92 TaxID=3397496 RepID=UPI0039DF4344